MPTQANSAARILDAALTLFSERGYEATSTREICECAGISKPTLYYFHENKESIFRALIRNAMDEFGTLVAEGLRSSGDLRERMKRATELCFEDVNRRPRLWRLIFATAYSLNSPFAAEANQCYEVIAREVSEVIATAMESGEIAAGDIIVRVLVLMGAFAETVSNALVLGTPKLTRELAHAIIDIVLDGWLPPRTKG